MGCGRDVITTGLEGEAAAGELGALTDDWVDKLRMMREVSDSKFAVTAVALLQPASGGGRGAMDRMEVEATQLSAGARGGMIATYASVEVVGNWLNGFERLFGSIFPALLGVVGDWVNGSIYPAFTLLQKAVSSHSSRSENVVLVNFFPLFTGVGASSSRIKERSLSSASASDVIILLRLFRVFVLLLRCLSDFASTCFPLPFSSSSSFSTSSSDSYSSGSPAP